jgi:hypothetical protein
MTYVFRFSDYVEDLWQRVEGLIDRGWDKGDILDSDELPRWWTEDRPDLLRANVERVYEELFQRAAAS